MDTDRIPNMRDPAQTGHTQPGRPIVVRHAEWVGSVSMDDGVGRAVSASHDGTARVWNLSTGQAQHLLSGHTGPVSAVTAAADGARALTASEDGTARVWDLATGSCERVLRGHRRPLLAAAMRRAA